MALRTLKIFISSPGDVAEERLIARRVIGRLEAQLAGAVHLEPIFWEGAALVATASFQEQLVRPRDADIVLCILWSRLGTVLPRHVQRSDGSVYASGTEFEFEDAQAGFQETGRPAIVVYRKTAAAALPADPRLLDDYLRQRQALDGFVNKWFINASDGSLTRAFHAFDSPADFEDLFEAHLAQLVEPHLPAGTQPGSASVAWREGSPFRGLEAFEPQHSAVFFGRTAAVAAVLMKLRRQAEANKRFVLVVGMSGGGKSSLVRAGVLPLLTQSGVVGDATSWQQVIVRPSDAAGDLPGALARALGQPRQQALEPDALAQAVCAALDSAAAGRRDMVLFIDQLEEAFSDERIDAVQRQQFAALLQALAQCGRVWVLATLRSDIYPRLVELPALMALKEGDGQFDLLPPGPREIGQIIRLPAAAAGLRFEARPNTAERLDDLIRDAAAKNPGALPLLQFLLEELYKRRNAQDMLTFRAYEELGGVEGALAQRAETVVAGVSEAAQAALPTVLRELVTYGGDDEAKVMRRVAPRSAIEGIEGNELVDALLKARLLVSSLGEDGQPAVALAHEALLEFWPRLRDWQDQNRELIHVHARVAAAARAWERQERGADFLLARGKPLTEAVGLLTAGLRLTPSETALVAASVRRARQGKWLRAGAVSGLAVLSVVASVAAWQAMQETQRARVQATTAQRTSDFMVSLFSVADPNESRGEKVTVREILDRGVNEIRTGLDGEPRVRANLMRSMGQAYNGLGLYPKAKELLEQALAQAEQNGAAPEIVQAQLALANNRYVDGDYAKAEGLFRAAQQAAIAVYGQRHAATTASMVGLADSLAELERNPEAEALYRQALEIDLRLHGENHADTARTLNALAGWLYFQTRLEEARPLFERALSIRRSLYGDRHATVAQGLNNLGSLHYQQGQFDQAKVAWEAALPVYRDVFGAEHREVATVLNNLGRVELMRGQYEQAEAHVAQALAIDRKLLAAGHDDLVLPLDSLGMALIARGQYTEAQPLLDEALAIARIKHHWQLNQVLATQAELALATGQVDSARKYLEQAREALQAQYGEKLRGRDAWRAAVMDSLEGGLDLGQNPSTHSEQLLLKALPVIQARFGPNGHYTQQTLERLVRFYRATGNGAQAEKYKAQQRRR